jgi:CRP-like cAMP-binding protein
MVAIKKSVKRRATVPAITPKAILEAMPHAKTVFFDANTVIFREGTSATDCWLIVRGKVQVLKNTQDGESPLAVVKAGEFLGEMAMISGERRSASALALTKVEAVLIVYADFEWLMKTKNFFAAHLSHQFAILLAARCNRLLGLVARKKGIASKKSTPPPLDGRAVLTRVYNLWAV